MSNSICRMSKWNKKFDFVRYVFFIIVNLHAFLNKFYTSHHFSSDLLACLKGVKCEVQNPLASTLITTTTIHSIPLLSLLSDHNRYFCYLFVPMDGCYNITQISSYARQVDGIKIYLGPLQHNATAGMEDQLCCSGWKSNGVNGVIHGVILPGNTFSSLKEENCIEGEVSEIYGMTFDSDGNLLNRFKDKTEQSDKLMYPYESTRQGDICNAMFSDGESKTSEALINFETETVVRSLVVSNHSEQMKCRRMNRHSSSTSQELLESYTRAKCKVAVNSNCNFGSRQLFPHNEHNSKVMCNSDRSGDKGNNGRLTVDCIELGANQWHSRRTSLDVIKRKMQVKRNRAAMSKSQYDRVADSHVVYSESSNSPKRPKLKFMSAPGIKDKRKKQLTLTNLFKK